MSVSAKDVQLSLNYVTIVVDVHTSVSSEKSNSGLSNFCAGTVGKKHDPEKIKQLYQCPLDDCKNTDKPSFIKGRKEGRSYIMVPASELEAANKLHEPFSRGLDLSYHPASEILEKVVSDGSPYYLAVNGPATSPMAKTYALIAKWIHTNPDVALLSRWAPQTSVKIYRLMATEDGVLILQPMCYPQDKFDAPVAPQDYDESYLDKLDGMIRPQVTSFVPEEWVNLKKKVLTGIEGDVITPGETVTATILDLAAAIAASTPKPKRARKPAAKKSA